MTKKIVGNQDAEVIFIVDKIDENHLSIEGNFQILYNKITRRLTNTLFTDDFYIISVNEIKDLKNCLLKAKIIFSTNSRITNQINQLYKTNKSEEIKWNEDKYVIYENFQLGKIIIDINDFETLSENKLQEIISDIRFITISKNDFFSKESIFSLNDIVFYQFLCTKCNELNLFAYHKAEPEPKCCKECKKEIVNTEILIHTNKSLSLKYKICKR